MSDSPSKAIIEATSLLETINENQLTIISNQEASQQSLLQILDELTREPEDSQQLADTIRRISVDIADIKKFIVMYTTRTQ